MNKQIMEQWTKELESGYWEQGKYFLEHSGTYCIYGILANLAALEGICDKRGDGIVVFDNSMILVPSSVAEWAELKTPNGSLSNLKYSLAEMNDKGKSFKQLAEIIRNNWEQL